MNYDLISRAEAIDILDAYQVMVENGEENPYAWARLRMSELPPAQPEQRSFSCGQENDLISRRAAIDKLDPIFESLAIDKIKALPSAQPEKRTDKRTETHACDSISRQAVKHLDLFTKTYCRDKSVKDDLVFRCNQCDFQLPDGTCLVKTMAKKLCPDYREFGSMGDL